MPSLAGSNPLTVAPSLGANYRVYVVNPTGPVDYYTTVETLLEFQTGIDNTAYIRTDGTRAFTGNQSMGSNKLTNVADPTANKDAANKEYVDTAIASAVDPSKILTPAVAASTAAATLASDFENGDTLDGVTLSTGDVILIKDQASGIENGLYTVNASGAPSRHADLPSAASASGVFCFVIGGTTQSGTGWVCTNASGSDVVDTDALTFLQVQGPPSGGAPSSGDYVVLAANASMSRERVLIGSEGVTFTDAGPNNNVTLALDINNLTEDTSPDTAADFLVTYDTTASEHKKVKPNNLGLGAPFSDATALVKDDGDNTKLIAFQASGITTGTTRTITMPDQNVDLTPGSGTFFDASGAIDDLSDVTITSAVTDQVLRYNAGTWVNSTFDASYIGSGTVVHERGGLEADVSAYDGFIRISGGSTSEIKSKFNGTTAPGATDDDAAGYVVGSRWIDTTADKEYVCLDATTSSAVWTETTTTGASDVSAASTLTDNAIIRGDGGARGVQDSGITIDDSDNVSGVADLTATGVIDLGGATSFEVPNSATPTVNADGEIALDTTVTDWSHGILRYYGGEELFVVAMPVAQLTTPTDGYVVAYNATNDEFELVAQSGGSSEWTQDTGFIYLTTTTDDVVIGDTTQSLPLDPKLTVIHTGPAFSFATQADTATNRVGQIFGNNRAVAVDGDEGYIDFLLDDDNGNAQTFARLYWEANDVTNTTKDGEFRLAVMKNNSLSTAAIFDENGTQLTGAIDLGNADSLEIPNSATPTVNADGEIALDTTVTDWSHGIVRVYGGEELFLVAMPVAQLTTPTDGHVVAYNATNDEFELVAQSGGTADFQIDEIMPPASSAATITMVAGGSTPAENVPAYEFGPGGSAYIDYLCHVEGYGGGGITLTLRWSTVVANSNVVWDAAIRRLADDTDSMTAGHTYDFNAITVGAPTAAYEIVYDDITFSDGADMDNLADGESFIVRIYRDGAAGGDTNADTALLFGIALKETA